MQESKSIGEKITEARKSMGLSQAELAQQVSISPQAVGKWERGESLPDILTLNKLAEIFNTDLNYFSSKLNVMKSADAAVQADAVEGASSKKSVAGLRWSMSAGNWVDADFSGLSNLQEKFSASNMKNCKFRGADFARLMLEANSILGCDFSDANLTQSNIQSSRVHQSEFVGCALNDSKFVSTEIKNCNFSNANFTDVKILTSALLNCKIAGAVWRRTTFELTQITDTVFEGAILNCAFDNCSFSRVTFKNVTFENTFFKSKKLKGIQFIDCKADRMTFEFLKNGKADLSGLALA